MWATTLPKGLPVLFQRHQWWEYLVEVECVILREHILKI